MFLRNLRKKSAVLLLLALLLPAAEPVFTSGAVSVQGRERPLAVIKAPDGLYRFGKPVTVPDLRKQLADQSGNPSLHVSVVSRSGERRTQGYVCTGDSVSAVLPDGKAVSEVTAVIPGDPARCGKPGAEGCALLYRYLAGQDGLADDQLAAADLDRNGKVGTADLLLLKKAAAGSF